MIDVIRGALAEVEDYTRVTLLPVESCAIEGRAVGDIIHLLAELIENAVSYSPPYAAVTVAGQRVAHGFVVEIEDRGLGHERGRFGRGEPGAGRSAGLQRRRPDPTGSLRGGEAGAAPRRQRAPAAFTVRRHHRDRPGAQLAHQRG